MNGLLRIGTYATAFICMAILYLIFTNQSITELQFSIDQTALTNATTVGISLMLEALPFLMLGVAVSAVLHEFVPEGAMRRFIPRHPLLGVIAASLIGVLLPLCECGMVPVVRRLIQKGMPVYIGITYILASPIINPIVFASTSMAFRSQPEMAMYRMVLAFAVTTLIGLVLYKTVKRNPLRNSGAAGHEHVNHHQAPHDQKSRHQAIALKDKLSWLRRMQSSVYHMGDEFMDMGKYLLMGAFITAVIQTWAGREWFADVGPTGLGAHLFMMAFAYIISLCSTSDAFIAASFGTMFAKGPLLTFLVFGPMLDLKTSFMLAGVFRKSFIVRLSLLIAVAVLGCSLLLQTFVW
ncbi:permease [Paenibacillus apiarius]|uniref:permease n=1 Tax=Paenibacillus apiarius TaxID=46240 RepID=UPI0019816750|nr:permease [Paenibacillus apiarius]MBN3526336.1 permease [Paenibacillus apiarius]